MVRRRVAALALGIVCLNLDAWAAFDQMKVKYPSSNSDSRKPLNINDLLGDFLPRNACTEPFGQVKIKYRLTESLRP